MSLTLHTIESRPRNIGYTMPVREYGSAAAATAASMEARERLRRGPVAVAKPRLRLEPPVAPCVQPLSLAHFPEPEEAADPKRERIYARTAPLNMLAPPSWQFLLALAAVRSGIKPRVILGTCRSREVVAARYEAMALVYQHTQASMPQVGKLFNRDHSTVVFGLQRRQSNYKLVDLFISRNVNGGRLKARPPLSP